MHVSTLTWGLTVGLASAFLLFDVFWVGRRPHEPSLRESSLVLVFYLLLAVVFGGWVWWSSGARFAGEFYAGWLTEYSLSVDNLFVFLIIMSRFAVPRALQQTALLVGIILALVLRGLFIAAGAAAISAFSWVFYLFGAFLVYTAVRLARQGSTGHEDYHEGRLIAWLRRVLPLSNDWRGPHLTSRVDGRRVVTPMLVVLVALGTTDLLFALDSIPAIYGLTKEPYLVLMANIFALMGLRQLYFLIGGLLQRLVFLSLGLSALLGFIGIKLILHALHENELAFVNDGEHVGWAPDIPISVSLLVILGTLTVTTVASLLHERRAQ
jgi:TerC family integral membrane protein